MRTEERAAVAVALAVLLAGTVAVGAVAPRDARHPQVGTAGNGSATVTVSATGTAAGEAETATLRIASGATADGPGEAADRVAANVSRLREALAAANVSEEQIRTTGYDLRQVRPDERPERGPEAPNRTRYRAEQRLAVELSNTSRVGEVLDVAVGNGATAVEGVEFGLTAETERERRDRALEAAMTDARSQAEAIAESEGLEIAGVASVSTDGSPGGPVAEADAATAQAATTTIDPGPVEVTARVTVTYNATAGGT